MRDRGFSFFFFASSPSDSDKMQNILLSKSTLAVGNVGQEILQCVPCLAECLTRQIATMGRR